MAKPDLRDVLSENIRAYRQENGVSQDEFAAHLVELLAGESIHHPSIHTHDSPEG